MSNLCFFFLLAILFGGPIGCLCPFAGQYVTARALATFLIPGCVGREGSGWDLRLRPAAASGNLGTWKSGNLEIWGPGNPQIWRSGDLEIQKFGVPKIKQLKIIKIQIRSAQNVGKVWLCRKKASRVPFGAI